MTAGLEGEFSDNHRRESQLLSPHHTGQALGVVVVNGQASVGGGARGLMVATLVTTQPCHLRPMSAVILRDGQKGS